jgi:23S rRNA pseudouridine1911/1915/1917 synthase
MKRIQFLRVSESMKLSQCLHQELQLEFSHAEQLIHIGAIYRNFQRITEDLRIESGDLLRCHLQPKRFRTNICWSEKIVHDSDEFLIVDKPWGLPCQASLDNRIENVHYQLELTYKHPLFITHRLDVGTRGLLVLAKTKRFQTEFNYILESHGAIKIYQASTLGPLLPVGPQTHWMQPHPRAPKILADVSVPTWKICRLEILSGERQTISTDTEINDYRLQLHTGRTHQIRAQLSHALNPIRGDTLYGGVPIAREFEWHALECLELGFTYKRANLTWTIEAD